LENKINNMDQIELLEKIGNGETSTVQFKESFPHQDITTCGILPGE